MAALTAFSFFHLNLAFSSIEEAGRPDVIARCYWPLLRLAEAVGAIGVEATGYTLEEIAVRDPAWIAQLQRLIAAGKVEFIGSGYTQMIGPLVPAAVTEANLSLGHDVYRRFGLAPDIALVNEQAYSAGLVGLYLDAGYRALLMDWNNPASFHRWNAETQYRPVRARGADGRNIGLFWTDTVAFQMLQRYAHGDISLESYLSFVRSLRGNRGRLVCLYASDAEIFDYRPGRYRTEEVFDAESGSEWGRLEKAFAAVASEPGMIRSLLAPYRPRGRALRLESPECPVPVKKQRKYNLSRWAVTGRDDIALNAACERIYRGLSACGPVAERSEDWKELCRLWASDYRTHITEARWQDLKTRLAAMEARFPAPLPPASEPAGEPVETRFFEVATPAIRARLDRRRGLALDAVSFAGSPALVGTLPLGVFEDIAFQADWYTGDSVFEAPGEHKVTDLEWCTARMACDGRDVRVAARIDTPKGPIEKHLRFSGAEAAVDFDLTFDWSDWGKGCLRLAHVTLLPDVWDWANLRLTTHNGGREAETFFLVGHEIEHGAPVSFLVSASQGLGLTEGWAEISDGHYSVRVVVDRGTAPLMGILTHRKVRGGPFCQFSLSALELDDTRKPTALFAGPRRFRFRIAGGQMSATC